MAVNTDHERRSFIFVNTDKALQLLSSEKNADAIQLFDLITIQFVSIDSKNDTDYRLMAQFAHQFSINVGKIDETDCELFLNFTNSCYQQIKTKLNEDYRLGIKILNSYADYQYHKKEYGEAKKHCESALALFTNIVVSESGDERLYNKVSFLSHDIDNALLISEIVELKAMLAQNNVWHLEVQQQNYQQAIDLIGFQLSKFSKKHGLFSKRDEEGKLPLLNFASCRLA